MPNSSYINNIPSSRVIFRSLLSFLVNFDRLELYIYHNRMYSMNFEMLILSVNNFLSTKSTIASHILEDVSSDNFMEKQKSFIDSLNYKEKYINYQSFSESYQRPQYFDNINESFIYLFPFTLAFFILLKGSFKVLFQKSISLLFRKF